MRGSPLAFEHPLSDAGSVARLQRALYGAYRDGCNHRIVQFDRNAGLDFSGLISMECTFQIFRLSRLTEKSYCTYSPPCSQNIRQQLSWDKLTDSDGIPLGSDESGAFPFRIRDFSTKFRSFSKEKVHFAQLCLGNQEQLF